MKTPGCNLLLKKVKEFLLLFTQLSSVTSWRQLRHVMAVGWDYSMTVMSDPPISSLSLSLSVFTFGISCSSSAHSLAWHGGWWPAWLMRRPDQRQKSSLGKTFVPRMDGISVGTTFPLGVLVVGTGGSCYQQKWQHDKRSDADAHTQTLCPTSTYTTPKALIRHLYFTSFSKLCFIQYLCTTANPLNPRPPRTLRYTTTSPSSTTLHPKKHSSFITED